MRQCPALRGGMGRIGGSCCRDCDGNVDDDTLGRRHWDTLQRGIESDVETVTPRLIGDDATHGHSEGLITLLNRSGQIAVISNGPAMQKRCAPCAQVIGLTGSRMKEHAEHYLVTARQHAVGRWIRRAAYGFPVPELATSSDLPGNVWL